jgi:acyl-coenzyme A synthetase/AMP-(fatty) acid ligase
MTDGFIQPFVATALAEPERVFASFEGALVTFGWLHQASGAVAARLRANGVQPGERVAVMLSNAPETMALLLGLAKALLELNRPAEALAVLERLGDDEAHGRTPPAALAMARAYEALGRTEEADRAFQWATERMPGFEALARHAAFMARNGRREEAREVVTELDKRTAKLRGHFRKEAQTWRDLAARAL